MAHIIHEFLKEQDASNLPAHSRYTKWQLELAVVLVVVFLLHLCAHICVGGRIKVNASREEAEVRTPRCDKEHYLNGWSETCVRTRNVFTNKQVCVRCRGRRSRWWGALAFFQPQGLGLWSWCCLQCMTESQQPAPSHEGAKWFEFHLFGYEVLKVRILNI